MDASKIFEDRNMTHKCNVVSVRSNLLTLGQLWDRVQNDSSHPAFKQKRSTVTVFSIDFVIEQPVHFQEKQHGLRRLS